MIVDLKYMAVLQTLDKPAGLEDDDDQDF